jgi:hypothetical protein
VLAAPASALAPLAPLLAARASLQPVLVLDQPVVEVLRDPAAYLPPDTAALVVVAPRRCGPRKMLPGLWVHDATGKSVPVGWLPDITSRLAVFAEATARLLRRAPSPASLAILGQWEDRFSRVALRTSRWFEKHSAHQTVFHWTADRVSRPDLVTGLQAGLGAAIYYGHGRANGWAGYHGVRVADFTVPWPEPLGALLALCCENASRRGGRLSFAEELVLRGVCGGTIAAAGKSRHTDNRRLGPALCEVLTDRRNLTLASLIASADLPEDFWKGTPYRFIGDPLAPLAAARDAATKAAGIFAPAPDEVLPAWSDMPQSLVRPLFDLKAHVGLNAV